MWRAPFRPNPFVLGLGTINGRSGQAIANTPRPAPCLRRTVGYHALSLAGGQPCTDKQCARKQTVANFPNEDYSEFWKRCRISTEKNAKKAHF